MIGRKVTHLVFGCGTITELSSAYLTVNFGDSEKKFVYPDAFEKFLTSADPELMAQVTTDLQAKRVARTKVAPSIVLHQQLRHRRRHGSGLRKWSVQMWHSNVITAMVGKARIALGSMAFAPIRC